MWIELPYLLQVQIILTLLWLFYRLVLRQETHLGLLRAWLLWSIPVAFLLPLCHIPVFPGPEIPLSVVSASHSSLPVDEPPVELSAPDARMGWLGISGLGSLLLGGLILVRNWSGIRRMRRSAEANFKQGSIRFFYTPRVESACSLFRWVFLNREGLEEREVAYMLQHEVAHVHLYHSWDRLLAEWVRIVLWWNPVVWMWYQSLIEVHEFQADRAVLDADAKVESYVALLLHTGGGIPTSMVSGFGYSLLCRRLKMIGATRRSWKTVRIMLAIPLLGLLLGLFSFTQGDVVWIDDLEKNPQESYMPEGQPWIRIENSATLNQTSEAAPNREAYLSSQAPQESKTENASLLRVWPADAGKVDRKAQPSDSDTEPICVVDFSKGKKESRGDRLVIDSIFKWAPNKLKRVSDPVKNLIVDGVRWDWKELESLSPRSVHAITVHDQGEVVTVYIQTKEGHLKKISSQQDSLRPALEESRRIVAENRQDIKENQRVAEENRRIVEESQRVAKEKRRIVEENQRIAEENRRIVEKNQRRFNEKQRDTVENARPSLSSLGSTEEPVTTKQEGQKKSVLNPAWRGQSSGSNQRSEEPSSSLMASNTSTGPTSSIAASAPMTPSSPKAGKKVRRQVILDGKVVSDDVMEKFSPDSIARIQVLHTKDSMVRIEIVTKREQSVRNAAKTLGNVPS